MSGDLRALHHLFLQSIVSRRVLSESVAQAIHKRCCTILNITHRERDYSALIDNLNGHLEKFGFAIKRISDPTTRKPCLVYANTRKDDIAQMATDYAPQEIAFFRACLTAIMEAPNLAYSISHFDALNLAGDIKPKLSKQTTQQILDSFVANGWLERSSDSKLYSLGTRSIAELETHLCDGFPDETDQKCALCKELVFQGYQCPADDCECRMHTNCVEDIQRTASSCPECKTAWPDSVSELVLIGYDAYTSAANKKSRPSAARSTFAPLSDMSETQSPTHTQMQT